MIFYYEFCELYSIYQKHLPINILWTVIYNCLRCHCSKNEINWAAKLHQLLNVHSHAIFMLITIKSAKQKQSLPYQYSHALHISLYKNGNLQEFYISAVQFIIYKNKTYLSTLFYVKHGFEYMLYYRLH